MQTPIFVMPFGELFVLCDESLIALEVLRLHILKLHLRLKTTWKKPLFPFEPSVPII